MIIKGKAILLNKLVLRMVVISGILITAVVLILPGKWDFLSIYPICVAFFMPIMIYAFYLNRFELLVIGVEDEQVHFSFVNNSIYKRKDIKTTKDKITVEQKEDQLFFHIKNEKPAILRKAAVEASEWERAVQMFTNY